MLKLKPSKLKITRDNPFEGDALNRKEVADNLLEILRNTQEPLVISINAPWGQGKTTFLNMLKQHLENNSFGCLSLNAWKNDFSNEPMVSLLGDFEQAINQVKGKSELTDKISTWKSSGINVLKATMPAMLRIGTAGFIDGEALSKITSEVLTQTAHEALKQYQQGRESLEHFQKQLENLAKTIGNSKEDGSESGLPLIVMVDELDRCRPDYAVSYLECIKHFFNVENIVFIIAVDRAQIGNSLKILYGQNMDVGGYLRRFIDIEFNLPKPKRKIYIWHLVTKMGLEQDFALRRNYQRGDQGDHLTTMLIELSEELDLSLRDIEKVLLLISLVLHSTPKEKTLLAPLLAVLVILKVKLPELYMQYIQGKKDAEEVISILWSGQTNEEKFASTKTSAAEAYLAIYSPNSQEDVIKNYYRSKVESAKNNHEESYYQRVISLLSDQEHWNDFGRVDYIASKIDLFSQADQ